MGQKNASEDGDDVRLGSKVEELAANTISLLHPWELTVQQTLRLGGSGPISEVGGQWFDMVTLTSLERRVFHAWS